MKEKDERGEKVERGREGGRKKRKRESGDGIDISNRTQVTTSDDGINL